MESKKVNQLKNLVMVFLLLSSYVGQFFAGGLEIVEAVSTQGDVTSKLVVDGFSITKNGNEAVTPENPIIEGENVTIEYLWSIPEKVAAGDTFEMTLPDSGYFTFPDTTVPMTLLNPSGGPSLGTYIISGGKIIATLNEEAAKLDELKDGKFTLQGKADKAGENIDGGGNGSNKVPDLSIEEPSGSGGGGNSEDDDKFKPENLPLFKNGKEINNENSINWSFRVNYQGINDMIATDTTNQGTGANDKVAPRKNTLLVDELAPGLSFQSGSLYVTLPIYIVNSNGEMGTRVVPGTNAQVQHLFDRVDASPGETLEDYKTRMENYPNLNNRRAYGVFTDSSGIETVVMSFGDLPGSFSYLEAIPNLVELIDSDASLTTDQKDIMKRIYTDPANSPAAASVTAYDLAFNVDVDVANGYGSGTYENTGTLEWGDNESEEAGAEAYFNKVGGEVQGDMIQAMKEVAGTGSLESPRKFEFELSDEADGTVVAYGITESVVTDKGTKVKVKFYKNKVGDTYSDEISGNEGVNGWKSVLVSGHTYVIREVNANGYDMEVSGGVGENGDRFLYNEKVNKITTFMMVNGEPMDFKAFKKVTGTATLQEETFTFTLKDSAGTPVAYGKTTVSAKDTETKIDFYSTADFQAGSEITDWKQLLMNGETYTLSEDDSKGYTVTYEKQENGAAGFQPGNTFVAAVDGGKIHFLVTNDRDKGQPTSVKQGFELTKELAGRPLVNEEFTFEMFDETDMKIGEVKNAGNGAIVFPEIEYTAAGTYKYTFKEVAGTELGMDYDGKTITATVLVTEKDDKLEAKVTYTDNDQTTGNDKKFENKFVQPEVSAEFEVSKELTGRELKNEEFDFEVYDEAGTKVGDAKNDVGGKVIFPELTYTAEGTYAYTIKEVAGTEAGMDYDGKTITVTVTVKAIQGKLIAAVAYSDSDETVGNDKTFENTYTKPEASAGLEVTKELSGRELQKDEFSFEVYDEAGTKVGEAKNDAAGKVVFPELGYDAAGTYTYTIKEIAGTELGMDYDGKTITATVVVAEAGGKLAATVTYSDSDETSGNDTIFENNYTKPEASAGLEVSKALTGRELQKDEFSFEVYDEAGTKVGEAKNDAAGKVVFPELGYDATGTYTYTIKEIAGTELGMDYDRKTIMATVVVAEAGGKLAATVTYSDSDETAGNDKTFENNYTKPEASAELEVSKELTGRELQKDEFSFEVYDEAGTKVGEAKNDAAGKVVFPELGYDAAGTYTYTIKEIAGTELGMDYDGKTITATVVVAEAGGKLAATVTYSDSDETSGNDTTFENKFTQPEGSAQFELLKELTGRELQADEFSFELFDQTGANIGTVQNDGKGKIVFPEIKYSVEGTYTYTIKEVAGSEVGMDYDGKTINVTVTVKAIQGKMIAAVTYTDSDETAGNDTTFENEYTKPATSAKLAVTKELAGRELQADEFSFEIFDEAGQKVGEAKNDANGKVSFPEIGYDAVGTYTYTIKETAGNELGMSYDSKTITATVTVSEKDGKYTAEVVYSDDDEDAANNSTFNNNYVKPETSAQFTAKKSLTGRELQAEDFSFELFDEAGTKITEVKNDQDGTIEFPEQFFDQAGTYTYTIKEVVGSESNMKYDQKTVTVTVTVTEVAGKLTTAVTYEDDDAVENTANQFDNEFREDLVGPTQPVDIAIAAAKKLEGRPLKADEFTFALTNEAGEEIERVKNDAEGKITFKTLNFDSEGQRTFYIKEIVGDEAGMTYDGKTVKVVADITKVDDKMTATITYSDDDNVDNTANQFVNTFKDTEEPVDESGSITLKKIDSEDGTLLAGAEFSIYTAEGVLIKEKVTTTSGGTVTITDLPLGAYYAVETKAPEGYQIDETPMPFEVKAEQTAEATAIKENKKEETGVILEKIDGDTEKSLAGAVFEITDSEGKVVATEEELTTDENGLFYLADLPDGEYTIVETKAPEGYQLDKTPYKFSVKTGKLTLLTVKNFKVKDTETPTTSGDDRQNLPQTGSVDPLAMSLVGLGCVTATAALAFVTKRRKAK